MRGVLALALSAIAVAATAMAASNSGRDAILAAFAAEAKKTDAGFVGFSPQRGQAFFAASHTGGKPDTPSCTTCHTRDPTREGQTRAGKQIAPMAVSMTPDRFTDPEKVAKWFLRNCNGVLGRDCTPVEKGDFITYLSSM